MAADNPRQLSLSASFVWSVPNAHTCTDTRCISIPCSLVNISSAGPGGNTGYALQTNSGQAIQFVQAGGLHLYVLMRCLELQRGIGPVYLSDCLSVCLYVSVSVCLSVSTRVP